MDKTGVLLRDKRFGASLLHGLPLCGVYEINMGERGYMRMVVGASVCNIMMYEPSRWRRFV